jgi:hypothetical protein
VLSRRGKHPAPARQRWGLVAVTIALLAATLPVPDGLVRWVLIATILAGFIVVTEVLYRRSG